MKDLEKALKQAADVSDATAALIDHLMTQHPSNDCCARVFQEHLVLDEEEGA